MSPEKTRVFIAEDSQDFREDYEEVLKRDGHTLVVSAATKEEALSAIEELGDDEIEVALVDGNLNAGDISGNDGEEIAGALRRKFANIKIISVSSLSSPWADARISKADYSRRNLSDIIKEI